MLCETDNYMYHLLLLLLVSFTEHKISSHWLKLAAASGGGVGALLQHTTFCSLLVANICLKSKSALII